MTHQNAMGWTGGTFRNLRDGIEKGKLCPVCFGTGWEEAGMDGYGYPCVRKCTRCQMFQKHVVESRIRFLAIPKAFRNCRLDSFKLSVYRTPEGKNYASAVCRAVKYWLAHLDAMRDSGRGLYFYSRVRGSGKTRMAASIGNELSLCHGLQVKFATSIQILNEIKKSWGGKGMDESELLEGLTMAAVLVLDDFGAELDGVRPDNQGWINDRFYHIINQRCNDGKITIFTSNFSIDDLMHEERITSRIRAVTFQVAFPEESVREYIAEKNNQDMSKGLKG